MNADKFIENCRQQGIIVPRTPGALQFMLAVQADTLKRGPLHPGDHTAEFSATVCHGGCCINYTCVPHEVLRESHSVAASYIEAQLNLGRHDGLRVIAEANEACRSYVEEHSFTIYELTGMN